MKYRISDIARMVGQSVSALRFFEQKGLIEPSRDENNNYRHYEAIDLNRVLRVKTYTECGFSLAETRELICEWTRYKPFSQSLVMLPRACFDTGKIQDQFVMLIQEKYASLLGICEQDENVRYYPPRKACLFTVIQGKVRNSSHGQGLLERISGALEERGLVLDGDVLSLVLHTGMPANQALSHTTEFYIPVKTA